MAGAVTGHEIVFERCEGGACFLRTSVRRNYSGDAPGDESGPLAVTCAAPKPLPRRDRLRLQSEGSSLSQFRKGQWCTEWPKSDMQPKSLGSMRPLQFTVNAFPTLSQHFVSIPAIGPQLFDPAEL
jgi:hypothetical protein